MITYLIIREMHIKPQGEINSHLLEWLLVESKIGEEWWKSGKNEELLRIFDGNSPDTMEMSMKVPQKIKKINKHLIWPSYFCLYKRNWSKKFQRYLLSLIYFSLIKMWKIAWVSIKGWLDKEPRKQVQGCTFWHCYFSFC